MGEADVGGRGVICIWLIPADKESAFSEDAESWESGIATTGTGIGTGTETAMTGTGIGTGTGTWSTKLFS